MTHFSLAEKREGAISYVLMYESAMDGVQVTNSI